MKYQLPNNTIITIPDQEIKNLMVNLDLSQIEAVQCWLEDNEYLINEEQEKLDQKAKKVRISMNVDRKTTQKKRKPQNIKVSEEKKELFTVIHACLTAYCEEKGGKCEVLRKNKLFSVNLGEKNFKIDLIQTRK